LYGKHYDDTGIAYDIQVHGGLTYASMGKDGLWWFGFDCAHAGDLVPRILMVLLDKPRQDGGEWWYSGETYRTWDYVENEVRKLVRQLRDEDNLTNQIERN
jgi:hypothetical protein